MVRQSGKAGETSAKIQTMTTKEFNQLVETQERERFERAEKVAEGDGGTTMKPKSKPMTPERAEQLLLDELNGKSVGTINEWKAAARVMWALHNGSTARVATLEQRLDAVRTDVVALVLGTKMIHTALPGLDGWLDLLKKAEHDERVADYHCVTQGAKAKRRKATSNNAP